VALGFFPAHRSWEFLIPVRTSKDTVQFSNSPTHSCLVVLLIVPTGTFFLIVYLQSFLKYNIFQNPLNPQAKTHIFGVLHDISYLPNFACGQAHDLLSEFIELWSM